MKAQDIIESLFEIKHVSGIDHYYFRNKAISDEPLFQAEHYESSEGNIDEYQYAFENEAHQALVDTTRTGKERWYEIDINLENDSVFVSGMFRMMADYNLSDAACVTLYELGFDIVYVEKMPPIDYIYYDKTSILRRNSIKEIIS
jgi:hypothetical protein